MKILLGGIPLGRNNVGDEAILACDVQLLRSLCSDAAITVSTHDGPATAAWLGVQTCELFGFAPPWTPERRRQMIREHDVFIWGGATGLSDYPESVVPTLEAAHQEGRKTVLWNVGMNDDLNPVWFRFPPGARRNLLAAVGRAIPTLHPDAWQRRRELRMRQHISRVLAACDLVVLRDPESLEQLQRGGPVPGAMVGADPALALAPSAWEDVPLDPETRAFLAAPGPKLGLCISAQREVRNADALIGYLDRVTTEAGAAVVFLPMNPVTDASLMAGLQSRMRLPARSVVVRNLPEPADVMAVAAKLDAIVSSRLHLLIFASVVEVPPIGISRGSKVDNFLGNFGLKAVGSVESCDFARLWTETTHWLTHREEFRERNRRAQAVLRDRAERCRTRLRTLLNGKESS